jgi:hypothetical protein
MLYEYLSGRFGGRGNVQAENAAAGKGMPAPPAGSSQHTLSPADLAPAWRGPPSHKEARGDRPV